MSAPQIVIIDPYLELAEYLADEARDLGFSTVIERTEDATALRRAAESADAVIVDTVHFGAQWLDLAPNPETLGTGPVAILTGACDVPALELDAGFCRVLGVRVSGILPKPLDQAEVTLALRATLWAARARAAARPSIQWPDADGGRDD
ncbi:hypothetical protein [Caenispirillum salinarum]|uniref:hypothetical protein n=1 Tax=Caenispirillum salinarum TaxID=859058 RepID=UPI00384B0CDB